MMRPGMKRKGVLTAVGVLLLALAAYIWYSPYLFLTNLQKAIMERNTARLERMVDFPRLREGLKNQLMTKLTEEVQKSKDPFSGLGLAFASLLIDPLVNALLTPEGLAALGRGVSADSPPQAPLEAVRDWRLRYSGFNLAYIYPKDSPKNRLYLERVGLFGWKVVRMDLEL